MIAILLAFIALIGSIFTAMAQSTDNAVISHKNRLITYGTCYTLVNIIFHLLFAQLKPTPHTFFFGSDRFNDEWPVDKTVDQLFLEIDWRYREYIHRGVSSCLEKKAKKQRVGEYGDGIWE